VIHCCGDNSRYDPLQGARVIAGPAPQPLAAVLLEWDPGSDQLHAVGTRGGEMFDAFFEKYAMKLSSRPAAACASRAARRRSSSRRELQPAVAQLFLTRRARPLPALAHVGIGLGSGCVARRRRGAVAPGLVERQRDDERTFGTGIRLAHAKAC
jgi:hypothetical protein